MDVTAAYVIYDRNTMGTKAVTAGMIHTDRMTGSMERLNRSHSRMPETLSMHRRDHSQLDIAIENFSYRFCRVDVAVPSKRSCLVHAVK